MKSKSRALAVAIIVVVSQSHVCARADVDLSWAPQPRTVATGVVFDIALFATTDDGLPQSVAAMDVLLSWNPMSVELLGVNNNGPYNWLQSGFPSDSELDGLNNTFLDGDAKYTALAALGSPAVADPAGLLVTTFQFMALAETEMSAIVIEPLLGSFSVTRVFGADSPNQNVTGALYDAAYSVIPAGECDGDGDNDFHEFQHLQICFTGGVGPVEPPAYPTAPALCCSVFDYDDDGDVDLPDVDYYLAIVTGP